MLPKITVVITNKDYNHFLGSAIQSIRGQTYQENVEIIVVDDASENRDFTNVPDDVQLIKLMNNLGQAKSTNIGFTNATGRYYMRMDADDWLAKDCLLVMSSYLNANPKIGFVYSDYWSVHQDETNYEVQNSSPHGPCMLVKSDYVVQDQSPHGSCMLMRSEVFWDCGGYDVELKKQEDYALYKKLVKITAGLKAALPLWYYRQHEEQKSNDYNNKIRARQKIKDKHENKILAIIPAREGSQGVPGKNLYKLDGVSLVARAIRMVKMANIDALIVVATDSEEIKKIAKNENVDYIEEESVPGGIGIIKSSQLAVEEMKQRDWDADIVITVQATSPFTPPTALKESLDILLEDNLDAMVSMSEWVGRHPYRSYIKLDGGYYNPLFPGSEEHRQRQDRVKAYQFTGGFYIRRTYLLQDCEYGFCLGENWKGYLIPPEEGIDIDTPMDLWLAESIARHTGETK